MLTNVKHSMFSCLQILKPLGGFMLTHLERYQQLSSGFTFTIVTNIQWFHAYKC